MLTSIGWSGRLDVTVWQDGVGVVDETTVHNQITRLARDLLRDALRGQGDADIKYIALGAGSNAPSDEDTQLQDERFRKLITSQQPGDIGELTTVGYIAEGEANDFTINEIGWFAGDATAETDTGILVARVLYTRTKTTLETLQLTRTDSIVEA